VGTKTISQRAFITIILLVAFVLIAVTIWVFDQRMKDVEKSLSPAIPETKEQTQVHR